MMHAILLVAMKKLLSDTRGTEDCADVGTPLNRGLRVVGVCVAGTGTIAAVVAGTNTAGDAQHTATQNVTTPIGVTAQTAGTVSSPYQNK